jgi:hypothetical protein
MDHSIGQSDACVPDEGEDPGDQGERSPHDAEWEPRIIRVDPARWSELDLGGSPLSGLSLRSIQDIDVLILGLR